MLNPHFESYSLKVHSGNPWNTGAEGKTIETHL